jgi:hypothetical protein
MNRKTIVRGGALLLALIRFDHWLWKLSYNTSDYYDNNTTANDDDTSYHNTIRDTESLCGSYCELLPALYGPQYSGNQPGYLW